MYTPSKIKISMLCALALCGQVRRDDLAIFARTADAGVRTIRELEDKGLIEDKTVEVTVRIDGRNRPRMRHVCGLTNAGLLFLLTHGASLFPWLASVPKEIVGRVNLKGGSCTRRIPLDRRLDLSGANCFFIAAGYETRPLVFDENMKEGKPSLASCLAEILPPLDARNDRSFYNVLEIKRDILGNGMAARFARYVGFVVHGGMPAAVYVVPQGGLSWGTSVVNKERALFDDFVLRGMHTAKDMGHDCILLVRKPRDLSRTLAMEPGKVVPRGMRYVVPMSREGMRDLEYIQNWGYHKLKAACSESISEAGYAKNTEKGTIPGNAATRISTVCPLIDPVTGNYITIGPLITIHVLKENAALMQVGKPITVFCFPHQMAFYRAALGEEIDFLLASAEGAGGGAGGPPFPQRPQDRDVQPCSSVDEPHALGLLEVFRGNGYRGNEHVARSGLLAFADELHQRAHGDAALLARELVDRTGQIAILDALQRIFRTVIAVDLDLALQATGIDGLCGAESHVVIGGDDDVRNLGKAGQDVFGNGETLVTREVGGLFGYELVLVAGCVEHLVRAAIAVVGGLVARNALQVDDLCAVREILDDSFALRFRALEVVGGDIGQNFRHAVDRAVDRDDGDAGGNGFLDHRRESVGIGRSENDAVDALHDGSLDIGDLLGSGELAVGLQHGDAAELLGFIFQLIRQEHEVGEGEGERRNEHLDLCILALRLGMKRRHAGGEQHEAGGDGKNGLADHDIGFPLISMPET